MKADSPMTYVKPGLQPFLFIQGTADKTVPYVGTLKFESELQAANVPCDMIVITNGQHRIADWDQFHPDWQVPMIAWLNDKLGTK
jgi:dipeptidyl aminopeptidase/acylaminoacyl peptidase